MCVAIPSHYQSHALQGSDPPPGARLNLLKYRSAVCSLPHFLPHPSCCHLWDTWTVTAGMHGWGQPGGPQNAKTKVQDLHRARGNHKVPSYRLTKMLQIKCRERLKVFFHLGPRQGVSALEGWWVGKTPQRNQPEVTANDLNLS